MDYWLELNLERILSSSATLTQPRECLVLYCGFDINTHAIAALLCSKVASPMEGYIRSRFGINPNG
ncbi:hypothetical protein PUN4_520112 [Paraburkholderia unamae]|nr:hypothetical protein PUN4_520112 [Paraburkholderia unamae]